MSVHDLTFTTTADGEVIYEPETVSSTPVQITVTNYGTDDLTNLGLYVVAATTLGDVDAPATYPPATDYQDLITWGTKTDLGLAATGGIYLSVPQNGSVTFTDHVTRTTGSSFTTKIPFIDLAAGDSATFSVTFQTPTGTPARRFYIDLKLE